MEPQLRRHRISFKHACAGLWWAVKTQPNFKVHLVAAATVVILGKIFNISPTEWLVLVLTIFLVLTAELINTALEAATDLLVEKKWSEIAKIAKDVASAAVLVAALGAVAVGWLIFGSRVVNLLN